MTGSLLMTMTHPLGGMEALLKSFSEEGGNWRIRTESSAGITVLDTDRGRFRMVGFESLPAGFGLGLLGAQYQNEAVKRFRSLEGLDESGVDLFQNGRSYVLMLRAPHDPSFRVPLGTFVEDPWGNFHLVEVSIPDHPMIWAVMLAFFQIVAVRSVDFARFDTHGDFMSLGGANSVERHSTEKRVRHLSRRVVLDDAHCIHCLRCADACNEMKASVGPQGVRLLGPLEDYCTNCGLCRKRCPFLKSVVKATEGHDGSDRKELLETGTGIFIYGTHAGEWAAWMDSLRAEGTDGFPYVPRNVFQSAGEEDFFSVSRQTALVFKDLEAAGDAFLRRGLLVTEWRQNNLLVNLIRPRATAGILCCTDSGGVERDLVRTALRAGLEVKGAGNPLVPEKENGFALSSIGSKFRLRVPSNETTRKLHMAGLWDDRSLETLWRQRAIDLVLAPRCEDVPPDLQREITREIGRDALILAPHLPQRLPVTRSPMINALAQGLRTVFEDHPELLAQEAAIAKELLSDVPRNTLLLHARYRALAFASGHSACPSCAEAQVLAIPVYMAMAMSLERGEVPQVAFTCETGCMSETLNKITEVSQKVPGGRTVFGGGFAFVEAMSSVFDRAVRMGLLKKGRRYVISQGGDGGAVIGLPAWLNALRQQAALIRQRHPNCLHFITVTDTQVYSNTGGESSATSMLGMGTLTTPIGKALLGNQRIQWNLINLAAEFPGILVGMGHSANRVANQQFWREADRLGVSAIRWDVTPCPETGKFFGEDPDDQARIMAHAGMLPDVVFYGRYRKRVAPIHPEDAGKPYDSWCRNPKPILYWVSKDPRYKALLKKNPETGDWEPRNTTARFLLMQLETYRDQLNWEIDLETHFVRQAEGWVEAFLQELKDEWEASRNNPTRFAYRFLFNEKGEFKPEYAGSLRRDLVLRVLGWDDLRRYVEIRDGARNDQMEQWKAVSRVLERLEAHERELEEELSADDEARLEELVREARDALERLKGTYHEIRQTVERMMEKDRLAAELFPPFSPTQSSELSEQRRAFLRRTLDRIVEERAIAKLHDLQQHRLSQKLKKEFLETGGLIRSIHGVTASEDRTALRRQVAAFGPFSIAVASLAGDRGIAINRVFAQFLTAKGAWAGMAWQFGSSKRGTPVLSATFVDSRPLERKDAMQSFPCAVLVNTNFEEMKREPDLFFAQLRFGGCLVINHTADPRELWRELVEAYPDEIQDAVKKIREEAERSGGWNRSKVYDALAEALFGPDAKAVDGPGASLLDKCAAMVSCRVVVVDMDGLMERVTGRSGVVSNLVAVAPIFDALLDFGFPFDWSRDWNLLVQGFPGAVLKNPRLLNQYKEAMEQSRKTRREWPAPIKANGGDGNAPPDSASLDGEAAGELPRCAADPGDSLMIMGGTLAGMVLSQIAMPEHPLFYVGFPITPAGNPFYAMAEAFANGHPYIVVDENNPSEKVAAEKLLGVARTGMFLPVTCTASQGWRLFTEIIPQFVGARLEGIFLLTKRALAAPNLNIEESHTDFMSFRDDGGIMLAPKSIQEYVSSLYLARLLTHFAKLPVIVSIGGITDTHKIGLIQVPEDRRVRQWLRKTLRDFDFLEHKILNTRGERVVHGPSCTAATYQETQSELEKAHAAVRWVWPYAVKAVEELTGVRIDPLEVRIAGASGREVQNEPASVETLLILQGSLVPNAVEALQELEEEGWRGLAVVSVRLMNPFPEEELKRWVQNCRKLVVLDRSNSFGSIPPLASRVLNAVARSDSAHGLPTVRCLVGGLGGREITVAEMRDLLLSSHLLLDGREPWERQCLKQWLDGDPVLGVLVDELVALEYRNLERHTRVPSRLRTAENREGEKEALRREIRNKILKKDHAGLLAHYGQVEFVAPREVLGETELRRRLVVYLERKLALQAARDGKKDPRRALVLLNYGAREDRETALAMLENGNLRPWADQHLLKSFGFASAQVSLESGRERTLPGGSEHSPGDVACPQPSEDSSGWEIGAHVPVDEEEKTRIGRVIQDFVIEGENRPIHFNPEDYDHALLDVLEKDPDSQLHRLVMECKPGEVDRLKDGYLWAYRDHIDRCVHREVLSRYYAPELLEIFEGDGKKALLELVRKLHEMDGEKDVSVLVETFLRTRVLPRYTKTADFYLEYFRNWVWPELESVMES